MIALTGLDKSGGESWGRGEPVYVCPTDVMAIVSQKHSWHSFRPSQSYATIYLRSGQSVDVYESADEAYRKLGIIRTNSQ